VRSAWEVEQIRAAEKPLLDSLPAGTLMQRAATGLARRCAQLLGASYGARVVLLVGSGDNGADALFAGARLCARGVRVDALLAGERVHGEGAAALRAAGGRLHRWQPDVAARVLSAADLVVDGLVGIGASGPLRSPHAEVVEVANAFDALRVAVDVPSGVDADTGEVKGVAFDAHVTVTFGGLKPGLAIAPGLLSAGVVEVVDIGLNLPPTPYSLLDAADVAARLPHLEAETDKYRRGVLGVAAGSDAFTGAPVLVVGGALATGVGMVRYAGASAPADVVRAAWPEAVVSVVSPGQVLAAGRVQAWAVGPGLGTDAAAVETVAAVLGSDVPAVVDADAITVLADRPELVRDRPAPTLLTPHAGELARLLHVDRSAVESARLAHVRRAAADLGVTVLLKGSSTLVGDPDGSVRINTADTPELATAGSGDVLTGVCAALMAGGLGPLDAGSVGAFLHGLAGLVAAGAPAAPITASAVVAALPHSLRLVG
jgi:hydroxyethylthiazole kinase-like uncharacterized protein yjeF